ncbi:hypothetical protein [Segatella bryantii]|uniref:hypothetical protein n=1 Tax=Segatella bryantii TaxID=77095 RepID=UPI00242FDBFA|nr:hypothetical protein [Segatella bryantii]
MDNYTESYLRSHCVDLFFRVGKRAIHVQTDGCLIPHSLSDVLGNRRMQHDLALSYNIDFNNDDYQISYGYISMIQERVAAMGAEYQEYIPTVEQLVDSHRIYSCLGFYSYACVWDDENETRCKLVLVTRPSEPGCRFLDLLPRCDAEDIRISDNMLEIQWAPYID